MHANSARLGLHALVNIALTAAPNVPAAQLRSVFCSVFDFVVHLARRPASARARVEGPSRQVMEIAAVPAMQVAEADFAVEPIFVRPAFGAPMRWTGAPLPEELRDRLDAALVPEGASVQAILEGRCTLV